MIRAAVATRRRCGEIDELVHGILAAGGRPLSAYDIAAQVSERTARIVPAQVYRTLARLLRQRRALRIEMLGAYVLCPASADLCLVCLGCCRVQLIVDEALRSIRDHATRRQFRLTTAPVEAGGLCDAFARQRHERYGQSHAMTDLTLTRRTATLGLTAAAFAGLTRTVHAAAPGSKTIGYGPLVPDPAGLLDLPRGFSYRILSAFGDRIDDGLLVPDHADGMGCIPLPGGRHALVRNHELAPQHGQRGAFAHGTAAGAAFDRDGNGSALPGGTTTLVIDDASGRVLAQHLSLAGAIRNCAGGTTPWGSWLTCEEDTTRAGNGLSQDHGWVFEVPAMTSGRVDPVPLRVMGRFNHEAAAVDPRTGIVYLTEDRDDSLLYRFLPDRPGRSAAGGRLQALAARDPARRDSRNWTGVDLTPGEWLPTRWIDFDGTDSPDDNLRMRGAAKGALRFARGEGIHMGRGELYLCGTSGGVTKLGQIMSYRPAPDEGRCANGGMVQIFVESTGKPMLDFGDNLTVAPNGHLVVCEDQYTETVANRLIGVIPAGQTYVPGFLRA